MKKFFHIFKNVNRRGRTTIEKSKNPSTIDSDNILVIDLDTGTILGSNVVVVQTPSSEHILEEILTTDEAAFNYGIEKGTHLLNIINNQK